VSEAPSITPIPTRGPLADPGCANIVRLIVIFSNVHGTRLGAMSTGINDILHNEPAGVTSQGLSPGQIDARGT
jgi:hypothetical protein